MSLIAEKFDNALAELSGLKLRPKEHPSDAVRYELDVPQEALHDGISEVALTVIARTAIDLDVRGTVIEQQIRIYRPPLRREVEVEVSKKPGSGRLIWWELNFLDGPKDSFAAVSILRDSIEARGESAAPLAEQRSLKGRHGAKSAPHDESSQSAGPVEPRMDQIIRGAYDVIASKGFANASTREIAKAAGMPIPTMYHYIKSKDDLLSMIFEHFAGRLAAEFKKSLSQSTDLSQTLQNSIIKYLQYCEENRKFINLIYRETKNIKPESRDQLFELDKSFTKVWSDMLMAGVEQGQFDVENPDLTAEFIYFLCTIWAIRHWSLRSYSQEQISAALVTFILRGVNALR